MNRKRVGFGALFGAALTLAAIEPAAAQVASSTTTEQLIWGLNSKLLYAAIPITVLVEGILIYTVLKYRDNDDPKPTRENRRLEITWTVATAVILLFVGVASYQVLGSPYVSAEASPAAEGGELAAEDDLEKIRVVGQTYLWSFEYDNVNAEGVSASGLTLEDVTIEGATVESTEGGLAVEDAQISGNGIESGTLAAGTVTDADANRTGDGVDFESVTVESAEIEDATLSDVSVSSTGTLVMPTDQNVRFNVTSKDWLHSFHVPGMGLKMDAFPGKPNYLMTKATETGTHQLYCAEYCGVGHSGMLGEVDVRSQDAYQEWLVDQWVEENS